MFHEACRTTHAKLLAGTCPWCGCFIVGGEVADAGREHTAVTATGARGQTLKQVVETSGPLTPIVAARYACRAAECLSGIHAHEPLHRNIQPNTIVLTDDGDITIIGSPVRQFEDGTLTVAEDEDLIGAADYLAPEQVLSSYQVDARADVYGLGCTLYYLLCGHPPFPDGTLAQRLMKHQTETTRSISEIRPDVPRKLIEICSRMMAKRPDDRFQTADDAALALKTWLEEGG